MGSNEIIPMRLMCLDTWSLQLVVLCGEVLEPVGSGALLEEVCHEGVVLYWALLPVLYSPAFSGCEYPDPDCSAGLSPSCHVFPTMIGSILSGSKSQIGPCLLYAASGHGFSHQQKAN